SSPRAIARQDSQTPHGLVVGALNFSQFSALARMRAMEVLPVPRVPVKRKAWATRPDSMARLSVCATWSCPTTSSKSCDRYFRASTVYDMRWIIVGTAPGYQLTGAMSSQRPSRDSTGLAEV